MGECIFCKKTSHAGTYKFGIAMNDSMQKYIAYGYFVCENCEKTGCDAKGEGVELSRKK
jgi:hypothetical protein